jgi:hypothetical protein
MQVEMIFEIERILSLVVATLAITSFMFTIRHRKYYSCWARSAILLGAIVEAYNSYNCFLCNPKFVEVASLEPHIQMAMAHIGYSTAILLFVYTILRFKWSIQKQYKKILHQVSGCDHKNCEWLIQNLEKNEQVDGWWFSYRWPWIWHCNLHINKNIDVENKDEDK